MSDILFIKTSSLGDVIHHMPALTEARRHLPDARFAWVVEVAYAPLVRLHPAVNEVIPVALRQWRSAFYSPATWRERRDAVRALDARAYDKIIDTQGLLKSALLVRRTRGEKHGYDRASITERLASLVYDVRHSVSRDLHAIDRNRILTAQSLGYVMQGVPDYGLGALRQTAGTYAVLLHATARPEKEWPLASWIEFGRWLERDGLDLMLPWGNERERVRAEQIAAAVPRARVTEKMPLDGVTRMIAGARFVVGVDTGLLHLGAALGVPLVAIFRGSEPKLTGPMGPGRIEIVGSQGETPSPVEVTAALRRVLT
ncbi:MAG: lipopolysaccharide heptosyltransferase I [Pseudolabrys sp.]|nr:lipopolysaccharide heptosyltransferase I [Pseudolabrys sp.]